MYSFYRIGMDTFNKISNETNNDINNISEYIKKQFQQIVKSIIPNDNKSSPRSYNPYSTNSR